VGGDPGGGVPESGGSPSGGASTGGRSAGGSSAGGVAGGALGGASGGVSPATGGSSGGSAPMGGQVASGGTPSVPVELIDDMEDANSEIYLQAGRTGFWYTSADSKSSVTPAAGTDILMPLLGTGEVGAGGGSTRAFHLVANGVASTDGYGALGGFDLVAPPSAGVKVVYDASAYSGIKFFAKATTAAKISLRLPIKDTTSGATSTTCTKCDAHFAKDVTLPTSWQVVQVLWPVTGDAKGFTQPVWGVPQVSFDPKLLVGVQFVAPNSGTSVDVWIDDISFIPR
jgi:hypothetical protein